MNVIGAELLREPRGDLKFLLNNTGIVFFPGSQQHRDVKAQGINYEHDYKGNAVAGLIMPNRVEIRFHKAFSDERIRNIWTQVLTIPEVEAATLGCLYYQGRPIN